MKKTSRNPGVVLSVTVVKHFLLPGVPKMQNPLHQETGLSPRFSHTYVSCEDIAPRCEFLQNWHLSCKGDVLKTRLYKRKALRLGGLSSHGLDSMLVMGLLEEFVVMTIGCFSITNPGDGMHSVQSEFLFIVHILEVGGRGGNG